MTFGLCVTIFAVARRNGRQFCPLCLASGRALKFIHLICDGRGVPLAIQLTGANRNDSRQALALVDAIPRLRGEWGRPRHGADCVLGDRGYDAESIWQGLRVRHIVPFLAKRNTDHGSGLGRWRWVLERTFAWLNQFRRLRVRYERRADILEAFLCLGCALICWRFLRVDWVRVKS